MMKRTWMLAVALLAGLAFGFSLSVQTTAQQTTPRQASTPAAAPAAASSGAMSAKAQKAFVQKYCVTCHNDAQMTGGLSLQSFDPAHVDPSIAGVMVGKLKAKAMPPQGMLQPDDAARQAFIAALSAEAVGQTPGRSQAAAKARPPARMPKRTGAPKIVSFVHHGDVMTVAEQNRMVHTICTQCHIDQIKPGGLSFEHRDMRTLPIEHPQIAEQMLAKLRAGMMPKQSAPVRPDQASIHAFVVSLENRIDQEAARHPNPGRRVFQRLNRPEYANSIKELLGLDVDVSKWLPPDTMSHNFDNIAAVQGFSPTVLQGYLNAAAQISRLAIGDPNVAASTTTYRVDPTASQMKHVAGAPFGTRGGLSVVHNFPASGTYSFKVLFFGIPTGQLYGSTVKDEKIEISIDGQRRAILAIDPHLSQSSPQGLTMTSEPIAVTAGPHRVSAAFPKDWDGPIDDLLTPHRYTLGDTQIGSAPGVTTLPHLRRLVIAGPTKVTGVSSSISRRKVFICRPTTKADEVPCATKILKRLATEAYRRPVTASELQQLMQFYQQGRKAGDFEDGIRVGLQAVLASPRFIFRFEARPRTVKTGASYRVGDLALASRLSYFLWAQSPDAELIELAQEGRLHLKPVLDAQVERMLKDPRAFALSTRFAYHWLRLQDVSKVRPDAKLYPMYDATIEDAMIKETELFFNSIVTEDRNVLDLLTADYTFVNQDLAAYYGIPDVAGPQFRRVSLKGTPRRGLLGEGSIQVETSVATRSDPVLRGKWILQVLIGQPPPPPPPGVNTNLDQTAKGVQNGKTLTVRERMEMHRANPVCASCHNTIDPLGLALEHFGPAGHFRIKDHEMPVDSSTVMYDGTHMDGLDGLVTGLMKHKGTFLRVFTKNLMAYALGRQIQYFDMPSVRSIIHQASRDGNRFSAYILGIVNSDAFLMNRQDALSASTSRPSESKKGS